MEVEFSGDAKQMEESNEKVTGFTIKQIETDKGSDFSILKKEVISHGSKKETYEEFVDKFKPKKTTDDCYTPPEIYEAVKGWAIGKFNIPESAEIIRPFYPGGNYMAEEYPEGCVVIDNPPFSILKQICDYYDEKGVHYVLFCPALTSIRKYTKGVCYIHEHITYENGAKVPTAFVHNYSGALETEPELNEKIKEINDTGKGNTPKYTYPDEVITASVMMNIVNGGIHYRVDKWERVFTLDSQKPYKKAIYGGGALVSRRKAEEARRKAEEARRKPIEWKLSNREKAIVDKLDKLESD